MQIRFQYILSLCIILSFFSITAKAQQLNDAQFKTKATPITNSLSYISKLQPVSYIYNREDNKQLNLPSGLQFGFIAADVQQVAPSVISARNYWYSAGKNNQRAVTIPEVDLQKLVPLLVGAVQEQQNEIEKLKLEVERLKQNR